MTTYKPAVLVRIATDKFRELQRTEKALKTSLREREKELIGDRAFLKDKTRHRLALQKWLIDNVADFTP